MIGCAAFDRMLEESAAAARDASPTPEFLEHLAACPACMAVFVGYSRAADMARGAYDPRDDQNASLPDSCVSAILAAVRAVDGDAKTTFGVA